MSDALGSLLGPISGRTCLCLAVTSGLGEELLFRAAIQPELGLLATSLLFGVVHWPVQRDLVLWPVFAFVVGLLLGWLFLVTGAVIAPAVAHGTVNLINLRHLSRRGSSSGALPTPGPPPPGRLAS